jgi:RNA polymerase sigma-70 factor, ECF subfamily
MYAAQLMDHDPAGMTSEPAPDAMRSLMHRVAETRDRAAFQSLFVHFGPRLKSFMMRKGAAPELAEELMQETLLTVWTKATLYNPEKASVATWVFTIARNLRIDRLRREPVQHFDDVDDLEISENEAGHAAGAIAQDEHVNARQEEVLIARALETLPEDQAEIIRLSFMDDLSQSEVAERLGLPLGTVKSRTRLAYGKLRQALEGRL